MNAPRTAADSGADAHDGTPPEPVFAYATLVALVVSLQFSAMIGLVGFRITRMTGWSFIGVTRDLLVACLVVLVATRSPSTVWRRMRTPSGAWAIVTTLVFLLLAARSSAELQIIALNLRRIVVFPLLFIAVAAARLTSHQVERLFSIILLTTVATSIFGVAEYLAPESLWRDSLRVVEYYSSNPLDPFGAIPFEESGRFFSWDLEWVLGGPVRRAVSTYLEPTTLAASLVAGLGLAYALRQHGRRIPGTVFVLLFTCGSLTLSKGFALSVAVLGSYVLYRFPSPRRLLWLTTAGCAVAYGFQSTGLTWGGLAHAGGLASAVQHVVEGEWLGRGVGLAGNYALGSEMDLGGESGLGNLIAQAGVLGMSFVFWIQKLGTDVLAKSRSSDDRFGIGVVALILSWFVMFLFSASSLGIGGNSLVFLVAGLFLNPAFTAAHHGAGGGTRAEPA